jgi:hypothetical protein
MLKCPSRRIAVIGSGHFGFDPLHRDYQCGSRARDPTGRCRQRHGRDARPASGFSPAPYEKMRFDQREN